jgi:hypothetical protein
MIYNCLGSLYHGLNHFYRFQRTKNCTGKGAKKYPPGASLEPERKILIVLFCKSAFSRNSLLK